MTILPPSNCRFYDWNMQYNEKAEIKGDFSIEAGISALLVREKQQENLMIYSNLSMAIRVR